MDTVLSVLVSLMQRKLKFVAAICFIFVAMLLWQGGMTGTNIAISIALFLMVGLFFVLVWFWTTIFQSMKAGKSNSQEKR